MRDDELLPLGRRIRELRLSRRLSQDKLSELCGISSRHVSEMERAECNPSYLVLHHLAQALDVPLSDLLACEHQRDDAELREALLAVIQNLPSAKLKTAYRLLSVLAE